jgi:hypothetical protein
LGLRRRLAFASSAILLSVTLAGCDSPPPWAEPSGATTPTPAATVAAPIPNDLSAGSTQRVLTAGAVTATIDYWSTLMMDRWTAGALKPVSVSMLTTIVPNDGQKVYLQKASMIAIPGTVSETFDALPAQVDQSTVAPGYLVLDPYSYSQTFNIGAVPAEATLVTLQFTYDFLVQTTPTSSEYAKQSASDTMTIAIAPSAATE